jgi:hypothetical protein
VAMEPSTNKRNKDLRYLKVEIVLRRKQTTE